MVMRDISCELNSILDKFNLTAKDVQSVTVEPGIIEFIVYDRDKNGAIKVIDNEVAVDRLKFRVQTAAGKN